MKFEKKLQYSFSEKLSSDELAVLNEFLSYYRDKTIIVADSYRQDFNVIPLAEEKIIHEINEDIFKCIDFSRNIYYRGFKYNVKLSLWRPSNSIDTPKCLSLHELVITDNETKHFINLSTNDVIQRDILFNIISIFNENKIISPSKYYAKKIYTNKILQEYINNHEWDKINTGIEQKKQLANALFIINEGYESSSHYTANFATILYQLINFRKNNISKLNEKELLELDKLILKLSKTELVKLQLHEQLGESSTWPTDSILLEKNYYNSRLHESIQYTPINNGLIQENKILKKCINKFKK